MCDPRSGVCRQMGVKCRLVYVGSGTARVRSVGLDSRSTEEVGTVWPSKMEVFPGKGLSFSMKMEVLLKSWDLTIENVDECESWTGKCMGQVETTTTLP